jgi:simple sugar transport system ATP-binding protein
MEMTRPARLSIRHLTKRFGPVVANQDVSLDVLGGELHCLLGENGAGKSTLSSCLYGLYRPDDGEILVDGHRVDLNRPRDAIRAGIGMVHQHFVLVPTFTVLENIVVGTGSGMRLDRAGVARRIGDICREYDIPLAPDRLVGELSVGEQQWVEIVKALYTGARLLILDEPTAVLTPEESRKLFAVIRRLTESDISVILISHKMAEVMQSDRVSVLRKGRLVATVATADVTHDQLTAMMIGTATSKAVRAIRKPVADRPVLSVRQLTLSRQQRPALADISFAIAPGEILGIAGVSGNGQDELFACLNGLAVPDSGGITIDGREVAGALPAEIADLGVGYVPSDRFRDGLVADLTLAENLVLGQQWTARWRKGPFLDGGALKANAEHAIADYAIAAPGPAARCGKLSGGNAQKVILAREFAKAKRILLCNQPTRGLDIGAVAFVQRELLRKRDEGSAILLASEELDDLFQLADRIAVMFRGRFMAILDTHDTGYEEIGRLMAGQEMRVTAA